MELEFESCFLVDMSFSVTNFTIVEVIQINNFEAGN